MRIVFDGYPCAAAAHARPSITAAAAGPRNLPYTVAMGPLPRELVYGKMPAIQETTLTATHALINPLAERLRRGELGLTLMIRHARTVDIALAARTCGFDALF